MKAEVFISIVLLFVWVPACNSDQSKKSADKYSISAKKDGEMSEISFKEYEYDFGKITEGEKVAHIFSFENKGPGDLLISSASTSCGCTVTKYDQKPIPPGGGGILEVVFDSNGRSGIQTKTISVRSNSKTEVVVLKITAEVVPKNQ